MKYSNAFWLRDWLDSAHFHSFNKLNMKFFRQNIRLKNIKINRNLQYKKKKKKKKIKIKKNLQKKKKKKHKNYLSQIIKSYLLTYFF